MTAATMGAALSEIVILFTDYFGLDNVDLPNKPFEPPAGSSAPWAKVLIQHTDMAQASLSDVQGRKLFDRAGVGTIELYSEMGVGIIDAYATADAVVKIYQSASTSSDVWFRNVTVIDRDRNGSNPANQNKWYQLDVVFDFTYYQYD